MQPCRIISGVSQTPFLSLIIPAFNEEKRLPETLLQVHNFISAQKYSSEVLVIENGSLDKTYQVAKAFCEKHSHFSVQRAAARGKGLAVQQGMLAATGQYRIMLDADLSMPIEEVNRFLPPNGEKADIVIASREAPGAVRYKEPGFRHLGGRLINTMIRLLALPGLQDTQCGFKGFRGGVATDLFSKQTILGWAFDVEILYMARLRGYSIEELPIPWYYRSQSHVRPFHDTFQIFFDILRIKANARKGRYD